MSAALYTVDGFVEDGWTRADTAAGRLAGEKVLLAPKAFHLLARDERDRNAIGVILAPEDDVLALRQDIGDIELIAIQFPKFSDGRGYSQAVRLRETLGYTGRLRAVGDVLLDQVQLMFRTGFDELLIENEATHRHLAAGDAFRHTNFTQKTVQSTLQSVDRGQGYVWRFRAG